MTVAPDSRPLATTAPGSVAAPVARAADLPYPSRVYAWYVVGLLTLAYAISLLDRWILSLLVGPQGGLMWRYIRLRHLEA